MKIEKITLYVDNQEMSKKFWCEKIGFEVKTEFAMGETGSWLELELSNDETQLVLFPKEMMKKQNPAIPLTAPSITFSTIDIKKSYHELRKKEVKVEAIIDAPFGKMFTFYDNEDNLFLIRESK